MASSKEVANVGKKRKHDIIPEDEDDKLEIDVNAPEPPSKKAKRKEKKQSKTKPSKQNEAADDSDDGGVRVQDVKNEDEGDKPKINTPTQAKRSEYGIWIGNLPFAATKDSIRRFLLNEGGIGESNVTRVHLPTAEKSQNKGFAYVDFTTRAILDTALTLSERMIEGRSVLIKNSKSFEGRPQKSVAEQPTDGKLGKKEPNKRIFVGNLSFDVTKDELLEHFRQAGQVDDVHMATFQDTGKCKGFAWITFTDIEAAKSAVRGFIFKKPESEDEEEEDEHDAEESQTKKNKSSKGRKARKWFINRIHGRELRCEFAEDAQTRYKKRFAGGESKGKREDREHAGSAPATEESIEDLAAQAAAARQSTGPRKRKDPKMKSMSKDERQEERRKRFDARNVAPGKALANKSRASEAIVAGTGTKKTFE